MALLLKLKILFPTVLLIIVPYYIIKTRMSSTDGQSREPVQKTSPEPITTTQTVPHTEIYCYRAKDMDTIRLLNYEEPPKDKSIFFHETSCKSHKSGNLVINNRQACAVESAARLNPNSKVFLLYFSPGVFPNDDTDSSRYLDALLTYPNIKIRYVHYEEYVNGTAVEALYRNGDIERSNYPVSHASDVLRLLTLWRFGGIYFDLDIVVIKSLEDLPPNYTGLESHYAVNSAVLSFASSGLGHQFATECLEDLRKNFNGIEWAHNGPGLVTRFFLRTCNRSTSDHLLFSVRIQPGVCQSFTVYPPQYFYPVHWSLWKMLFRDNDVEQVSKMTKNSYTIHAWNQITEGEKVDIYSTGAYVSFAKQYCPTVFAQCKDIF